MPITRQLAEGIIMILLIFPKCYSVLDSYDTALAQYLLDFKSIIWYSENHHFYMYVDKQTKRVTNFIALSVYYRQANS